MNCPHCTKRLKKVGDGYNPTCGKSECQEAEYRANQERNKPKPRKLRPKAPDQDLLLTVRMALRLYKDRGEFDGTMASAKECLTRACYAWSKVATAARVVCDDWKRLKSDDLWLNNEIQFSRLLCELVANVDDLKTANVAVSMDLTVNQVNELYDRAEYVWHKAKGSPP